MRMPQNASWSQYALYALILVIVVGLRIWRMGKTRRLRLETLWIMPAIFFAVFGFIFYEVPPQGMGWLWCGLAFVAGSAIGWYRGRFIEISVHPETHELNQRTSPGAIIFIVVLIFARMVMKSALNFEASSLHLNAMLVSGIFISFAAGVLTFFRVELFVRARRLLADARSR